MFEFTVIDTTTNQYPDLWKIATTEEWAKHLMYCDMEGFAISEDGGLLLLDECGGVAYCPADRFKVVYTADVAPRAEVERLERILNSYVLQYGTAVDKQKIINEAKTEVAREIFEEIDRIIFGHIIPNDCAIIGLVKLAELKKKYTEGQK